MTEEEVQDSEMSHSSWRTRVVADEGKCNEGRCVNVRRS
jgi:hypothetical protein